MSRAVRPRIRAMGGYQPGEQPGATSSLIKLNTNENPYPPSPKVAEAIASAAAGLAVYPPPLADPLREAAAARYGVAPEQVLVGNGSDELLTICLRACACDGGTVAFPVPTYSLYETLAEIAGARTVSRPMGPGEPVPDELLEADPDLLFLCSPTAPHGAPVALAEIRRAATAVGGLVVADEAYVDFGGSSALDMLDEFDNLLVLRSFSKSFSLAGLRLGLAFSSAALVSELVKVKDSYNVSRIAIAGGVAALDDYAWMQTNSAKVVATRERVISELRAQGRTVQDSAANFFWLDCGKEGGESVYQRLRKAGILVRYFDREPLRGGVRVSVGTDDQMDRFLEALAG